MEIAETIHSFKVSLCTKVVISAEKNLLLSRWQKLQNFDTKTRNTFDESSEILLVQI